MPRIRYSEFGRSPIAPDPRQPVESRRLLGIETRRGCEVVVGLVQDAQPAIFARDPQVPAAVSPAANARSAADSRGIHDWTESARAGHVFVSALSDRTRRMYSASVSSPVPVLAPLERVPEAQADTNAAASRQSASATRWRAGRPDVPRRNVISRNPPTQSISSPHQIENSEYNCNHEGNDRRDTHADVPFSPANCQRSA